MPGDTLFKSVAGVSAIASTTPDADAAMVVRPPFRLQVQTPTVNTAYTFAIATTGTAITITSARFIPDVAMAANDTNYISMSLVKGDLAAGAATVFATIKTTQITGGTAMVVDVPWVWVIVTAASANVVAVDQRIKLVMTKTGTSVAWGGLVEVYYTLTN